MRRMARTIWSTHSCVFATSAPGRSAMDYCAPWPARCGLVASWSSKCDFFAVLPPPRCRVVGVELRFLRRHAVPTTPPPHVRWSADTCDTTVEAGAADVCPTPDELHLIYDDFSRCFEDLRFQFVEVPPSVRAQLPVQLFISGAIRGELTSRIHAVETRNQAKDQQ